MNRVQNMNRTEFVDLKVFYNLCPLHFSVGRVSMIASPSEKKGQLFHEVQSRGFDGTSNGRYPSLTFHHSPICCLLHVILQHHPSVDITVPNQPIVLAKPKAKMLRGNESAQRQGREERMMHLVPELCRMTGLQEIAR
jgi:hypothetical protein